jgi:hypothetical protein
VARTPTDIAHIYDERRRARGVLIQRMQEIRDTYNGDISVPLPELESNEKPFVANLVAEGIDQQGMRIASTMPDVRCPPLREGIKTSEAEARTRRLAILSWWDESRMGRKLYRRGRHLIAYGSTPAFIRPDFKRGIPVWEVENPLGCFPAPSSDPDEITPTDVIFQFVRNYGWFKKNHPEAAAKLNAQRSGGMDPNELFDVLRYVDDQEIVLVAVRQFREGFGQQGDHAVSALELSRYPNRAGICTATCAGRVTLDRLQGAFNQLVGMYVAQSRLMALEAIAVEKGIFPDVVISSVGGETPRLVDGRWHDGRTGKVNIIAGGRADLLNAQPGFQTQPLIDRLERNQRVEGGTPAQFSGEVPSNLRTGRANSLVLAASVDFRIQEQQETLALALEEENKRAIAISRAYFGKQSKTFYVPLGERLLKGDYVPNQIFTTDTNKVFYAMAGADANSLVIGLGQRLGIGTMSKRTARALDPMIEDYEREEQLVNAEDLERIAKAAFEQQAMSGAVPLVDVARIMQLINEKGESIVDAILKAQKEAQDRQAAQVAPSAPEAQPGLALPGQGVEPSIGPPEPSLHNLGNILINLRRSA